MKKLFLLIAFSASLAGKNFAQGKLIAQQIDGKYVITANVDSLLAEANLILKLKQNISGKLTQVSIVEHYLAKISSKFYCIKFTNSEQNIKLVQVLVATQGMLKTVQSSLDAGESITCAGCRKGCDPKPYVDKDNTIEFYCSECTSGTTSDCKKNVTTHN
jgi:hypothetical protein